MKSLDQSTQGKTMAIKIEFLASIHDGNDAVVGARWVESLGSFDSVADAQAFIDSSEDGLQLRIKQ